MNEVTEQIAAVEPVVTEETVNEALEGAEGSPEGGSEEQEFEVTRATPEGSQPSEGNGLPSWAHKRVNEISAKKREAESATEEYRLKYEAELEKNRILNESWNPAPAMLQAPDPDEFDGGEYDPDYKVKRDAYENGRYAAISAKQVQEQQARFIQESQNRERDEIVRKAQEKHYGKVESLKIKGYAEAEDKVIASLGHDTVNVLIQKFKDPHVLFYYMGKNPDEMAHSAGLAKSDPLQFVIHMAQLEKELQVKHKSSNAPNPDEPLEGGTPAKNSEAKLERLRVEAQSTGDMKKLMAYKMELKAKQK